MKNPELKQRNGAAVDKALIEAFKNDFRGCQAPCNKNESRHLRLDPYTDGRGVQLRLKRRRLDADGQRRPIFWTAAHWCVGSRRIYSVRR
jgi:hypothetical protein